MEHEFDAVDPYTFSSKTHAMPAKIPTMIKIPGGPFIMGTGDEQIKQLRAKEEWVQDWSDQELFLVEQPQHQISLPAFEIAQFPITNAEYYIFIRETGHRVPRSWMGIHFLPETEEHPVTNVSLKDALAYCEWLSNQTGRTYRLPTEAEWERAARGTDGRNYPWGNAFDPWRCNTLESAKRNTTPVGTYSPAGDSMCGAADMVGNVWEWTSSFLRPYPYRTDGSFEKPGASNRQVIRGGSWYYSGKLARCATREGILPTYLSPALGFRVASDLTIEKD
jgi:formylglycine-generating enzyme required for sulfatase activity